MPKLSLRPRSMKASIILWFSLLTAALILALQLANWVQLRRVANEVGVSGMRQLLSQTMNALEVYLYDIDGMARNIMADPEIQKALAQKLSPDDIESFRLFRRLQDIYDGYTNTRTHVTRVMLINAGGEILDEYLYAESRELLAQPWYQSFSGNPGQAECSALHIQNYQSGYIKVFSMRKQIYPISYRREPIGYLVINIDASILDKVFPDVLPFDGSCMILFNRDGTALCSAGDAAVAGGLTKEGLTTRPERTTVNGKDYRLFSQTSGIAGQTLAIAIPESELFANVYLNYRLMILTGLLAAGVIALASYLIVRQSLGQITRVTSAMKRAAEGDFSVRVKASEQYEMRELVSGFNSMVERLKSLIDKVYQEERRKKEAEIYALRAQISPHFLYNTLNSVRYLAKAGRNEDILAVTHSLILLSQASFERSRFITIRRELELVEEYVNIQKLRYGLGFEIRYDLDDSLMDCAIPGFVIQPLVENALFHGIAGKGAGHIDISVRPSSGGIAIKVADDGNGMDEQTLRSVIEQNKAHMSGHKGFTQIGLGNVDSRIKYFFDDRYGLSIDSALGKGTVVELFIPRTRLVDAEGGTSCERC